MEDLTNICIPVQTGDRLGVFVEVAPSSVSYTFSPNNPVSLSHEGYTAIGDTLQFDFLNFPYQFSVAAYIDTGWCIISNVVSCHIANK